MGFLSNLLGNAGVATVDELSKEFGNLLTDNETIEIGFKLFRVVFIFTNKRLILVDKQGITGKKIEYLSVVYKSISRFSIETAGNFDLDAELKIWISSEVNPSVSLPAFEQVDTITQKHLQIHVKKNIFYKEYEEVIKIGGYILKSFSFNLNKTSTKNTTTPPFWIDMSKLFELYVFSKLVKMFPEPNAVSYHDKFWGEKKPIF